jgi:Iron-sulfur cluster-binding domain
VRKAQQRAKSLGFNFALDPELWLRQPNVSAPAQPAPSAMRQAKDTSRRPVSECHEPWEWLFVAPLGGARPCCFASREVGNLRHQTVSQIWNGPVMVRLRGAIRDGYVDRVCRNAGCWFVRETERAFGVDAYDYRCEIDTEVSLRRDGRTDHCVDGWSEPEDWGVWSEGEVATLLLDLPEKPAGDLQLDLLCRAVGHERFPCSFVRVRVNGCDVARWEFQYPDSTEQSAWRTIDVRFDLLETRRLEVRFLVERPLSPQLWGRDDGRLLGVGLSAFKVRRAGGPPTHDGRPPT